MADLHDPVGVAKARGWPLWIGGRSSRREYWVYVILLIGIGLAFSRIAPAFGFLGAATLLVVQIRRVHDFGRSAWWAVGALLAPLACLPLMLVASEETTNTVGGLISLALAAVLGAIPGDSGPNRFGPPPPFTARRVLTGR